MTFTDNPDLLKKVITGDESWMYGYGIETKAQSSNHSGDQRKIETGAVGDTKKRLSEVFRRLEKNPGISIFIWRGLLWNRQDSYGEISKYFWKNLK